jgi:hypothetical protein
MHYRTIIPIILLPLALGAAVGVAAPALADTGTPCWPNCGPGVPGTPGQWGYGDGNITPITPVQNPAPNVHQPSQPGLPDSPDEINAYVSQHYQRVCSVLDQDPSAGTMRGLLQGVENDSGFTPNDSAVVLEYSIDGHCPRYKLLYVTALGL